MASWSVESVAVDGYGAFRDCLALGQEAYVMIPYNDTVQTAKDMIREFLAR